VTTGPRGDIHAGARAHLNMVCGKLSQRTCCQVTPSAVPCQVNDADLWFSEKRVDLDRAKAICTGCPVRHECLAAALQRHEPWGVWGGEMVQRGTIAAGKRTRGRPPKNIEESPQPERGGRPDRILAPLRFPFSNYAP
jgi:WhiB family transcriptional regulator, redox-sensing transcriptional regulator